MKSICKRLAWASKNEGWLMPLISGSALYLMSLTATSLLRGMDVTVPLWAVVALGVMGLLQLVVAGVKAMLRDTVLARTFSWLVLAGAVAVSVLRLMRVI
ncbi:hypothetical protein ACFQ3P_32645 [Paraburkholderia sabiae]|uniref:Uncharacterized protein n=1 Tax=Paraburkholderia sabiae TaxID=273251 RepID=A0ABU9QIX1_9BURK|nr:hypothetical protein [Paraburkholderia sabiae]WJZ80009.1 hypothetical protein QEN71_43470 [Paraburkholderia sabiae]CAD6559545.1 hypothetical protein LMG24235_06704 [Paraburkholderia sabiae]